MRFNRVVCVAVGAMLGVSLCVAFIFTSAVVFGRSGLLRAINPLVVDIQQKVPFDATIPVELDDSTVYTATVPLSLDVNLQIGLSEVISISAKPEQPALVAIRELEAGKSAVDSFGIPYEIIGDIESLEFLRWDTVNLNGDMGHAVLGEVRGIDPAKPLDSITFIVSYYDEQNQLINRLYASERPIWAGDMADFKLWGGVSLEPGDFSKYTIEVLPDWDE